MKTKTPCLHPYREHDLSFDCYFCRDCDTWLEEKCSDPTCEFCTRRPERPLS